MGFPDDALDSDGEVFVTLADGWTLRSGIYNQNDPDGFLSGEYVRLCRPDESEYLFWDQEEWRTDPALVMGAIINAASGFRPDDVMDTVFTIEDWKYEVANGDTIRSYEEWVEIKREAL